MQILEPRIDYIDCRGNHLCMIIHIFIFVLSLSLRNVFVNQGYVLAFLQHQYTFICFLRSACGPSCNRTCDRTSHGHSALIAPFVFKKVFVSKSLLLSNTLYWTWFWIPVTLAVCGRMTQPLVSVCVYICVCLPARDIKLFNNCWCTGFFLCACTLQQLQKDSIKCYRKDGWVKKRCWPK